MKEINKTEIGRRGFLKTAMLAGGGSIDYARRIE